MRRAFLAAAVALALVACGRAAPPAATSFNPPAAAAAAPSPENSAPTPSPAPAAEVAGDVAPALPVTASVGLSAPSRPSRPSPAAASSPRVQPTPWNPPLVLCPKPIDGTAKGDWVDSNGICRPDGVYAFVAPPGWQMGDPMPPWRPAPGPSPATGARS